ncbi:PREDICTED: adenylyl cyclase-associated protein 1-like isoform X2 [Bison bison bison]|uniref:Adenylyl cyclase-associated protein 1-like isoform X2 n=1 Tax=Bison bison bison TaxID=43346 RepID=A0A6P3IEP4_BISBB|nr:PREDICTED: adenylyl cyclase-associated protein 1-like isoform X2 [Bison bison bison]
MADMRNLVERLERVVGRLEAVSHASDTHCGYGDSAAKGTTPYVQAFDSLLAGPVAEYLKISKEIGGDVQKHVRRFGPFSHLLRTGGFLQIIVMLGLRAP